MAATAQANADPALQPNAGAVPDLSNLSPEHIVSAIKAAQPELYKKLVDQASSSQQDLASLLQQTQAQYSYPPPPMAGDPTPSSHPRGPPNLGQTVSEAPQASGSGSEKDAGEDDSPAEKKTPGGRRGGRAATMGSEEWTRQRKDNHKEVERRRRGNINDGINELGRIVPNGSGEKAKGAILSRAVQYIHHLKENEARNIEKWTLEKLLMDQAMGDLQAQLEEIRRLWETERVARMELETEVKRLKGEEAPIVAGQKRASEDVTGDAEKKQRTE